MNAPRITVAAAAEVAADSAALPAGEQAALAALAPGPRRRDEWIRGRIAARRALVEALGPDGDAVQVLVAPDGAPAPVGGPPCAVSLSHDGAWIAVAVAPGRWQLGVDVCARDHDARLGGILRWLAVRADAAIDRVAQWAALEAALKLRRWPIEALRGRALAVRARDGGLDVDGLDATVAVQVRAAERFVVAWAAEAAWA